MLKKEQIIDKYSLNMFKQLYKWIVYVLSNCLIF